MDTPAELDADFAELSALCDSACTRLRHQEEQIRAMPRAYLPESAQYLLEETARLAQHYAALQRDITASTEESAAMRIEHKRTLQDRLRMLQSGLGSVLSAGNWQSPSITHTRHPQAGKEAGTIQPYRNDYKRDRHVEAQAYAHQFINEYVEHAGRFSPVAHVTSSGMAAVTLAFSYLKPRVPHDATVLAGRSTYFQSRWILESLFPGKVKFVDSCSTEIIVAEVKKLRPAIVFFDTLSNNAYSFLDVPNLVAALSRALPHHATIVLDNTGRSVMCQPLHALPYLLAPRLMVVESLSKYHQFGLDRVNGGVLWSPVGLSFPGLRVAHANSGTIMSDAAVLSQPEPNRALLEARLSRIGRNARYLAECIDGWIHEKRGPISRVIYPSLLSHPAHAWAKDQTFAGGFFVCEFAPKMVTTTQQDMFVRKIFSEADKRNISLVLGTGFGFSSTRLYVLPEMTGVQKRILRVSAGTETAEEMQVLAEAFAAAMG